MTNKQPLQELCSKCQGAKKYLGLGCIYHKCAHCAGTGVQDVIVDEIAFVEQATARRTKRGT